ncbi:MAG TPA: adenylate/guanylate cyclase domain-containing protein [Azospirillaceae bacterium]|nr:adenylate/guanylate cyclase domain-containing protein [Azospirillaceae bacterium]
MNNAFEVFACDGEVWYLAGSFNSEPRAVHCMDEVWKDKGTVAVKLVAEIVDKRTGDLKDKVLQSRNRRDDVPYFNSKKATLSKPKHTLPPAPKSAGGRAGPAPAAAAVQRPQAQAKGDPELVPTLSRSGVMLLAVAAFLILNEKVVAIVPSAVGFAIGAAMALLIVSLTVRRVRPHLMEEIIPQIELPDLSQIQMPKRRKKKPVRKDEAAEEQDATAAGETAEAAAPEEPEPDAAPGRGDEEDATEVLKALLAMTAAAMDALRVNRGGHLRLDRHDRFGLCLFLAGAADAFADSIHPALRRRVTEEVVKAVASDPGMVGWFLDTMSVHLTDRKAKDVYRRGSEAGRMLAAGMPGAEGQLPGAMADWCTAAEKSEGGSRTVIMFTDLVGSTHDAWTAGDQAHLERVRQHDGIVRSALAAFRGREVKHTGDGIMAAFASETDAVGAGIRILEDFQRVRSAGQTVLDIRIGISAGPAMHEGADIFGRTVQLAARLTSVAATGNMAVSAAVMQGASREYRFVSAGVKEMKGVPDPVEFFAPVRDSQAAVA